MYTTKTLPKYYDFLMFNMSKHKYWAPCTSHYDIIYSITVLRTVYNIYIRKSVNHQTF